MLEITFSENIGGSLLGAKKANAQIGEVLCLSQMLSVGDLSDGKRINTLTEMFSVYPGEIGAQAAKEVCERAEQGIKTVLRRENEPVRVWFTDTPDALCGLCWLADKLSDKRDVLLVKLAADAETNPAFEPKLTLPAAKLTGNMRKNLAARWQTLRAENSPLRAVVAGLPTSVGEDYYDKYIIGQLEKEADEFSEAHLIGSVLGEIGTQTSDAWLALRIEKMINDGRLSASTETDGDCPTYHRMLKKV